MSGEARPPIARGRPAPTLRGWRGPAASPEHPRVQGTGGDATPHLGGEARSRDAAVRPGCGRLPRAAFTPATEVSRRLTHLQVPLHLRGKPCPLQKAVRDRENEEALGGMRNPRWSLRWVPGAPLVGHACRSALRATLTTGSPMVVALRELLSGKDPDSLVCCPRRSLETSSQPLGEPCETFWATSTERQTASDRKSSRPTTEPRVTRTPTCRVGYGTAPRWGSPPLSPHEGYSPP